MTIHKLFGLFLLRPRRSRKGRSAVERDHPRLWDRCDIRSFRGRQTRRV